MCVCVCNVYNCKFFREIYKNIKIILEKGKKEMFSQLYSETYQQNYWKSFV